MHYNIIITDDDPVTVFIHSALAEKNGMAPMAFSNALDTLQYLSENVHSGKMNLVFLDINMPVMSGWDLLDKIVESAYEHVLVVLVSSSVNSTDHQKSKTYKQVIGYYEKPLSLAGFYTIATSGLQKREFNQETNGLPAND